MSARVNTILGWVCILLGVVLMPIIGASERYTPAVATVLAFGGYCCGRAKGRALEALGA